jgi:hypothetical protein
VLSADRVRQAADDANAEHHDVADDNDFSGRSALSPERPKS